MFRITMEGPGKNALGTRMLEHLRGQLREAAGRPVLLTGAGDAFSAGLDLKELAGLDVAGTEAFLRLLEDAIGELYLYPGPTVALVNGHAIAGGSVVALACDRSVAQAGSRARIGLNEVALGVRFPPRVLAVVRSRIPRRHHGEVLLGAGLLGVEEAQRLGLIDEVAADASAAAQGWVEKLGALPGPAYAATKRDLRGAAPSDLATDEALDAWMREALAQWTSEDVRRKIVAALAR